MVKKIRNKTFLYPYSGIFYNHLNLPYTFTGEKKNYQLMNEVEYLTKNYGD